MLPEMKINRRNPLIAYVSKRQQKVQIWPKGFQNLLLPAKGNSSRQQPKPQQTAKNGAKGKKLCMRGLRLEQPTNVENTLDYWLSSSTYLHLLFR